MSVSHVTVRYAETDQMGVAHHANYPVWFEIGRTDLIKEMGLSYAQVEERGVMLPLIHLSCTFKQPVRYDEKLSIVSSVAEATCVRLRFCYQVYNADGTLAATGETVHAWTDRTLKPVNIIRREPDIYRMLSEKLQKTDQEPTQPCTIVP
jgi:acyl-CoA thioester hydrolase